MINWIKDWWRARKNKYERQGVDARDFKYKVSGASLPQVVDISSLYKPARYQGSWNSCTGFATAALVEYHLQKVYKKKYEEVSPLYIWYWGKTYHNWEDQNKGVWLRNTLKAVYKYGYVPEFKFKYVENYLRHPGLTELELGLVGKMFFDKTEYQLLQPGQVKDALAQGLPVICGLMLNSSFYGNRSGIIKDITSDGNSHALLVVGYDDHNRLYKLRNSWGTNWGDDGYCFVPYDYFTAYAHDCWTIKDKVM